MNTVPPWIVFKPFLGLTKGLDRLRCKITPPPMRLLEMVGGYAPTQIVRTAAELGIADHLASGPKTLPQLAAACDADEDGLRRLMQALVALEVFQSGSDKTYALAPMGEFLRSDHPNSFRATVIASGREQYGGMAGLTESVKRGRSSFSSIYGSDFFSYLERNEESGRHFADSMAEISKACVPAILAEYNFSDIKHLVDVGGGTGALLNGILTRYPKMEGTLFDQHTVIERANIDAAVAPRCRLVAGDMFEQVPDGGDAYLLQRVLHDWHDDAALHILNNCRRVMRHTGRLILLEFGKQPEEEQFVRLHADLLMLSLLGGRERTEEEFRALLEKAGFKLHCIIETRSPIRIVEAFPERWGY